MRLKTKNITSIKLGLVPVIALFIGNAAWAAPKSIRATQLDPKTWSEWEKGSIPELLIEFQKGDKISVNLRAEGDLLETTTESPPSSLTAQRAFWLRIEQKQGYLSLDGVHFRPVHQLLSGSFTASLTSPTQLPNTPQGSLLSLIFRAHLK